MRKPAHAVVHGNSRKPEGPHVVTIRSPAESHSSASDSSPAQEPILVNGLPTQQKEIRFLAISSIRKDGQTQHRMAPLSNVVAEYADLMRENVPLPPIRVWWDGNSYWLSDGFQRVAAAEHAGLPQIASEIRLGTLREAQWDSYAANATHGARHTWNETQEIIKRTLQHPNAATLSNVQIAKHLHISEATVRRWRKKVSLSDDEDIVRSVTRGATAYTQNATNIGKNRDKRQASRRDFLAELAEMKGRASPIACRLTNVILHWVRGDLPPTACLDFIERIVQMCCHSAAPSAQDLARICDGDGDSR